MPNPARPEWRIATSSLIKIVFAAAVVWVIVTLLPLLTLLTLSALLATTLHPAILWLQKRMPRGLAVAIVCVSVILGMVGVIAVVIPALADQSSQIAHKLPELQQTVLRNLPDGIARRVAEQLLKRAGVSTEHVLTAGQMLLGAVSSLVLWMALALYLAADGPRTYAWFRAFFSPTYRRKVDETARECSAIVVAYVFGQFLTSLLCAVFVFAVMSFLRVPGALVLAVLAGLFDILPILGVVAFMGTATLFALTVSPATAASVLMIYLGYHLLENYLIVPKVYGQRLRLSDLVVLLSVLAGGYVGGIAGAVLSLPFVAAYPAVERIWLAEYVGRRAIEEHAREDS